MVLGHITHNDQGILEDDDSGNTCPMAVLGMQDGRMSPTLPVTESNGTSLQSISCSTHKGRMESIIKALEPDLESSDACRERRRESKRKTRRKKKRRS
jgi:hypothetical protein